MDEMKETEERGKDKEMGKGSTGFLVRLSKLVGRGSECITKDISHTPKKKKEALSCLV